MAERKYIEIDGRRIGPGEPVFIIAEISGNHHQEFNNAVELIREAGKAGADAVTLVNTFRGMAIDINNGKPALGNTIGGLSGPAIKPIALYMVYHVAQNIDIPVIGCGGISSTDDALEFIMAGATTVQVGTANLSNPSIAVDVLDGIEQFVKERKITNIREIVGTAAIK